MLFSQYGAGETSVHHVLVNLVIAYSTDTTCVLEAKSVQVESETDLI
jgi:hypothetical protein